MQNHLITLFLIGAVGCTAANETATSTSRPLSATDVGAYDPAAAVAYADAHWSDGKGLCAEFVSDAAIGAGRLPIRSTGWVPTLFDELAGVPFDEYPTGAVSACPGDIVVYSDEIADFCDNLSPDPHNCGHTGIVVQGGSSADTILADFHNAAHVHLPLTGILGAGYTTMRVFHTGCIASRPQAAFQANTGELWVGGAPTGLGMMPGTSPAVSGGVVAFQANTGELWVGGAPTGFGMAPGTSPAISGGEAAFQANTGELWTLHGPTGLGMMHGTSPAIDRGVIAFQANTGELWVGGAPTGLGMMHGTSPASAGGAIAFQANTGELWVGGAPTGLGMAPGSSPAL